MKNVSILMMLIVTSATAWAVTPSREEIDGATQWAQASFAPTESLPFSFTYAGQPSSEFLKTCTVLQSGSEKLDGQCVRNTMTFLDEKTKLEVRCVTVQYADFPVVEWTLYFKNSGMQDTPILENIQSLDMTLQRGPDGEFLLHHNVGSPANGNDYGPLETPLGVNAVKKISAAGGRPTNSDMSYFNIVWPGEGAIVVVGWPGQWAGTFTRDGAQRLHIVAGQELTHFKLQAGEEVRSPLSVVMRYKGDWIRGQNLWRRWMMAHSMPKPGGQLPAPMALASSSRAYEEMIKADTEKQIMFIDRYIEEGIKLDYWWMDAGWYIQEKGCPQVGTWEVDPKRFPQGFKPISDHAHANGIKILVWFEPESGYVFTDVRSGATMTETGEDLLQKGLDVNLPDKPGVAVFSYKKQ